MDFCQSGKLQNLYSYVILYIYKHSTIANTIPIYPNFIQRSTKVPHPIITHKFYTIISFPFILPLLCYSIKPVNYDEEKNRSPLTFLLP